MPRSKEFDPDQVLDRAVEVFWRKGYTATSLRDLLEAMMISRQSLYDTYGDKRGLFLRVIERYRQRIDAILAETAGTPGAGIAGIRNAFRRLQDDIAGAKMGSCLITNTAIELGMQDAAARDVVVAHLRHIEECFYRALRHSANTGELPAGHDLRALARHLTNSIQGIGVLRRAGYDDHAVDDALDIALTVVGKPSGYWRESRACARAEVEFGEVSESTDPPLDPPEVELH